MSEPNPTPDGDNTDPLPAPTPPAATPASAAATPSAGGCYLRDPATGALTLVTPSTIQE